MTRRSRQTWRFSGELTLTTRTAPPASSSSFAIVGIIARQGWQRGPQKSTKTLPSAVRSLYVSGVASTGISLLSWFQQNRHPIGQLGHTAEEERAFGDEHRGADLARAQGGEAVREPGDGGGDVALRGREAGQAVLALE